MTNPQQAPGLQIGQIFLEEASFRHRADSLGLPANTPHPPASVDAQIEIGSTPDGKTALTRLIVSTSPTAKGLYEFRVSVSLIVSVVPGLENMTPRDYAQHVAPVTLMPFAREFVANLTMRGRFGPVWVNPWNLTSVISAPIGARESVPPPGKSKSNKSRRVRKTKSRK